MKKYSQKGFSLIELLLVMVVISAFVVMGSKYLEQRAESTRIDKTVLQLQYLLNAGLAYYVANGAWPGTANVDNHYSGSGKGGLQGKYIANEEFSSPWGTHYGTVYYTNGSGMPPDNAFVAEVKLKGRSDHTKAIAQIIAGRLPASKVSNASGDTLIEAWVNIPGQSLANAKAVNFAGLYHQGACIPVPECPDTSSGGTGGPMVAQVFVVPVSVSGVNDEGSNNNIYPISSFTAFATASDTNPAACYDGDTLASVPDCSASASPSTTGNYWRACIQVITERGNVQETRTDNWGGNVTMAAFTRCGVPNEPEGSDFSISSH